MTLWPANSMDADAVSDLASKSCNAPSRISSSAAGPVMSSSTYPSLTSVMAQPSSDQPNVAPSVAAPSMDTNNNRSGAKRRA